MIRFDDELIKIEDLKRLLSYFTPEIYHPDDPRYQIQWRELRKRCIEGIWVEQFGKWRYMPGRLGFFGIFGRFEDWTEDKTRIIKTPKVRDLEWHRAYYRLEMDGFSGWENDDKYTSDEIIFEAKKGNKINISERRYLSLFKDNGSFKEYIPRRENIFMLHDKVKGKPLYFNEAMNTMEFGCRGGGKSYSIALMDILPDLCFDGAKYYNIGQQNDDSRAVIEVTSGGGGKSTELLEKVEFGMNCLADPQYRELGVWGSPEDPDFEPCPFYKRMSGTTGANNKENPWINKFKVKIGNSWKERGTKSRVYNTVYSVNQRAGAQKSSGGRRTYVVHEETGLNELLIEAWGANEGMVKDGGMKMTGQKGIGTSGNMLTVLASKKIFTHPSQFDCLEFHYPEYGDNAFGWFLPAWLVDTKFKDENGNTDIEAAKEYHWNIYNDKKENSLPEVFMDHRMNFPMKIEDMWVTSRGHRLPVTEAEEREKELMKSNLYQSIGTAIELYWDSTNPSGVNYKLDTEAIPFYEWPLEPDRKSLDPVFMMYIHPDKLKINGVIPNDAIIATLDPYISEEIESGGSLGVSHFFVNPKYIPQGLPGNCLAATLIGKALHGTAAFHEILEKGLAFYGNPIYGLWYEANRGDKVRADFIKKNKINLLCLRPQFEQGQFIFARAPTQTGYMVGNRIAKIALLDSIRDILLEETTLTINNKTETKRNIERFSCIFTLRQIKQYRIDGNFDAVSSLQGWPLALGEQKHKMTMRSSTGNPFAKANTKLKKRYAR